MQKRHPWSMAHWTSFDVKKYNLFAFETLMRSTNKKLGNPFGCLSDLSGLGSHGAFLFSGIDLALEAEPQGGAMKTPTTCSSALVCSEACNDHLSSCLLMTNVISSKSADHAQLAKFSCYPGSSCKNFNYHAIWDIRTSTSQCADAALASLLLVMVLLRMRGKTALATA